MVGKTHDVSGAEEFEDNSERKGLREKLKHPFPELREKLKSTSLYDAKVGAIHLKHRVGKVENLFNKNHRHDEEHEKETDRKRTLIAEGHRFQSFAPERDGNLIKWYVDGRDYYHAVSEALERATESIYIEDWWLSPELFLRRPPHFNQKWRLDYTLKRAAERGVKIYVFLYREVEAALTCNSEHSKHALEALCPKDSPGHGNIVIMRHPDHNFFENAGDMTFYWAHHEKYIVIDYDTAFIGGLDLCFGRWDLKHHPLADAHPAGVKHEVFPGQDFNNNRIMDFQTVEDWKSNQLSKTEYGRMPWHDVSMGLIGPCVYDIAEHFVLRWNFAKRDKYKRDPEYDWLTLTGRTDEHEDLIGVQRPKHPVGDYTHHPFSPLEGKRGNPNQGKLVEGDQQAVAGAHVRDGDVFHDAPERPAMHDHGYTDEQHRTPHKWMHDEKERIHEEASKFHHGDARTEDASPQVPHNDGQSKTEPSKQEVEKMTGNSTKKEGTVTASGGVTEKSKGYRSEIAGYGVSGGQGTVHAQIVRSSADWSSGILTEQSIQNAYCEIIRDARHYVYIENQFFITATGEHQAPVHNLIGKAIVDACASADKEGRKFRVVIVMPGIPGFAGDLRSDAAAGTRAIMDYQYKSICRGEHSIFGQLKEQGVDPTKYIFVFNLRSYDRINNTPEMKKQEQTSGVKYQELQEAHGQEIMGESLESTKGQKKTAAKEGTKTAAKGKATGMKSMFKKNTKEQAESSDSESDLDMDPDEDTAAAEKKREENEYRDDEGSGKKDQPSDSIAKNAMLGEKKVSEEPWPGRGASGQDGLREDEAMDQEKENFIQEQLYIHAKLMIADDRIAICGSSNINDRSQLGFHDSELAIVMEDTRVLPTKMDGKDYAAGHHAATLRRTLWREHLGLLPAQVLEANNDVNAQVPDDGENDYAAGDEWDDFVADPLNDELWKMWTERATTNMLIFRHLFHADPDDNIKTFEDYDKFMPRESHKAGHLYDPYQPVDMVRSELDKVKGHLVWMPLKFLEDAEMAEKGLQVNQWTESVYT